MLPPIKTPPQRRSFGSIGDGGGEPDTDDDATLVLGRKRSVEPEPVVETDDAATHLMPKNRGEEPSNPRLSPDLRLPLYDECTNFRPFAPSSGGFRASAPPPSVPAAVPMRPPAAGVPVASEVMTPFVPLTPERIQAQLDAARMARRRAQVARGGDDAEPQAAAVGVAWQAKVAPQQPRVAEVERPAVSRGLRAAIRMKGHVPWMVALAAMAVVGALAMVVIVEGSGSDELLRAGASFVDPSTARTEAAPSSKPAEPTPSASAPAASAPIASPPIATPPPTVTGVVVATAPPAAPSASASTASHAAAPKESKSESRDKGPRPVKLPATDAVNAAAADALSRQQLQQSM